jgi:GDP-4-dehydro-6-deoxy-D-mannose reductase
MRTVLLTGAQGFIGRHLCALWLERDRGLRVVGVGRSPESNFFTHGISWRGSKVAAPLPEALHPPAERYTYRQVDLTNRKAVAHLLEDESVDQIVHLAGSLRDEPLEHLLANNMLATHALCSAAGKVSTRPQLVIASSGSVYGNVGADGELLREDGPAWPVDPYAVTKRAAEDLAFVSAREHDLDVRIARIFAVTGEGQDERHLAAHLAGQIARGIVEGMPIRVLVGSLDSARDFIDVKDVATGLIAIAESGVPATIYNVASGRETEANSILDGLAAAAGRPVQIDRKMSRKLDFSRQQVDTFRLRSLNWSPAISIDQSLQTVLDYYVKIVASYHV